MELPTSPVTLICKHQNAPRTFFFYENFKTTIRSSQQYEHKDLATLNQTESRHFKASILNMLAVLMLCVIAPLVLGEEKSNNLYCTIEDEQLYIYRVPNHSCSCSVKSEGSLRYHGKKLQICNGQKYVDVGVAPPPPPEPVGSKKNPADSCHEILAKRRGSRNSFYYLKKGGRVTKVYCYMGAICGSRGWTMIMKIDGRKRTFHYDSAYWRNKQAYNPGGAGTGLGRQETKLETYWTYPFNRLCLGMSTHGTRWLTVNYHGSSLYNVIAPGRFKAFHVGRQAWKNLIHGSSLQRHCNREGFNVFVDNQFSRVRIGILSNQENNCNSPDSRIGFGAGGYRCGLHDGNTAGNEAGCWADNGNKHIYGFGYIFAK